MSQQKTTTFRDLEHRANRIVSLMKEIKIQLEELANQSEQLTKDTDALINQFIH